MRDFVNDVFVALQGPALFAPWGGRATIAWAGEQQSDEPEDHGDKTMVIKLLTSGLGISTFVDR